MNKCVGFKLKVFLTVGWSSHPIKPSIRSEVFRWLLFIGCEVQAMHFYLYIWLAVTVEVIEWQMFVRSLDCHETAYYIQPNSRQTAKPQLDTNVLADEIENYLWKCFFFLYRCWNMKEEQFYDATMFFVFFWVASLSCLPCARAVILRVSVDQWMLGLNFCLYFFLLMKLSIKKSTKSRQFSILVELFFLWLFMLLVERANVPVCNNEYSVSCDVQFTNKLLFWTFF